MLARIGFAVCAWLFAGACICGYWAILRRGEKQRAEELRERVRQLDDEIAECGELVATGYYSQADYERKLVERAYWQQRVKAWEAGNLTG